MQGAEQKVYVLEPTEARTNSNGSSFGITTALCKATNYQKVHDIPFRKSCEIEWISKALCHFKGIQPKGSWANEPYRLLQGKPS